MGDVEVPAQHRVATIGGQLGHPLGQGSHEPLLFQLAIRARLPGVHIQTADGRTAAEVDLQIAAVVLEFRCRQTDPDALKRSSAQDRDTAAATQVRLRRGKMPAVVKRRRQGSGELLVIGAGLLQAHHVGGALRQPGQQPSVVL